MRIIYVRTFLYERIDIMKKIISLLLSFIMVISIFYAVPFSAFAVELGASQSSYRVGDYLLVKNDDGVEILQYLGDETIISIPSMFGARTATRIGEKAFYRCDKISQITVPSSITSIGKWAFYGC